jgi:hypothetical protein
MDKKDITKKQTESLGENRTRDLPASLPAVVVIMVEAIDGIVIATKCEEQQNQSSTVVTAMYSISES